MQVQKYEIDCPPWALPREEVPVQVKIEKTATDSVRQVVVELPSCLRLVDTINIPDHAVQDGRVVVDKIDVIPQSEYDYFVVVVATKAPFEDLKKEVPVKASFAMKDGSVDAITAPVRIFRPRLEFEHMPDAVILKDGDGGDGPIPVRLKFSGWGDVTVRCVCTMGGRVVSYGIPLTDEVPRQGAGNGSRRTGPSAGGPCAEVYPARIHHAASGLEDNAQAGRGPSRVPGNGHGGCGPALLGGDLDGPSREAFIEYFSRTRPMTVADMISDILTRTLGENLQLESETVVVAPVELPQGDLVVEFRYSDVLGNEYDPIRKSLKVVDQRSGEPRVRIVPLDITADESGAFNNAGEARVGSGD